jgi:hypothetical protein
VRRRTSTTYYRRRPSNGCRQISAWLAGGRTRAALAVVEIALFVVLLRSLQWIGNLEIGLNLFTLNGNLFPNADTHIDVFQHHFRGNHIANRFRKL